MPVSYAQAGEDLTLWRLVGDKADGYYIDVGAYHYNVFSVSRSFYEAGWTGVNVEPLPAHAAQLAEQQPRSVTFAGAVAATTGTATLYSDNGLLEALSTLVPERAEYCGLSVERTVATITLAELCRRYQVGDVDWLKVDTEGTEEEILRSGDWARFRPRFCCIEAVQAEVGPYDAADLRPTYQGWEPFLLDQGYGYLESDTYNRYYARED